MYTLRNIEGEKHITGSVNRNLACATYPHNSLVTDVSFFSLYSLLILGENTGLFEMIVGVLTTCHTQCT